MTKERIEKFKKEILDNKEDYMYTNRGGKRGLSSDHIKVKLGVSRPVARVLHRDLKNKVEEKSK